MCICDYKVFSDNIKLIEKNTFILNFEQKANSSWKIWLIQVKLLVITVCQLQIELCQVRMFYRFFICREAVSSIFVKIILQ